MPESAIGSASTVRSHAKRLFTRRGSQIASIPVARLAPVINATGVVLHTNLGRAQVSAETADAMRAAALNAVALEIEPEDNTRGGRMTDITALMRLLTGAEATLVVNNNAAAVLLVLTALANGRSVVVSRGESIEIGGGFRIPDVLRQSGARLVEVGTTNRTYPIDYESSIDDSTAVLLKVHPSNFQISGFTASATVGELVPIAKRSGCVVAHDLGSGALLDTARFGLAQEPLIQESIAADADITMASGDKLLGGPQAGIIAGRTDVIEQIERHPLARALRADKSCLAGTAATLRHYVRGDAEQAIPVWRMISATPTQMNDRGAAIRQQLAVAGVEVNMVNSQSTIGGGSLPGQEQQSIAIAITADREPIAEVARRFRTGHPGVFGRIEDGRLLLDLRAVLPEQDEQLVDAVLAALSAERRS